MKKIIIFALILFALFGFLYFKYMSKKDEIVYITQPAKIGTLIKSVEASGEIYATQLINVGAQVGGQIKKLHVKLGDNVKKGDLIAEIDSSTQKNTIDNKRAALEIYQAQLQSAIISEQISDIELKRQNELYKKGATSEQNLQSARQSDATAKARIKELKAQISQAQIALNTAQIDLEYTKIKAPKNGTIVSVQVEEGQTLNSAQSAPTIVNIADLSKVKMKIQIAEGDITKIKVGSPVVYTILSEPNQKFKAKINSIDPALTTMSDGKYSSNSSSTTNAVYYYAQSIVENKSGLLRIGMSTQNSIQIAKAENAIIIPTLAIKNINEKKYVSILKNNKAEEKEVQIGISDNLNTQILSGINEGDLIITSQSSNSEIAKMIEKERR